MDRRANKRRRDDLDEDGMPVGPIATLINSIYRQIDELEVAVLAHHDDQVIASQVALVGCAQEFGHV